jgi:hypothetical protein
MLVITMNDNEILKPLNDIMDRAQELTELARAQEWEALDVAALKYQEHVALLEDKAYLKTISDAGLNDAAKNIIAKIQLLNDDLDIHTSLERERIASELRQMMQSNKALNAYGQ